MHGMKKFVDIALLCTFSAMAILLAAYIFNRSQILLVYCLVSGIASLVCLYGSGYFAGWLSGHEETRTIYRHDD